MGQGSRCCLPHPKTYFTALLIEKPVKLIKAFRFVKLVSVEVRSALKTDARGESRQPFLCLSGSEAVCLCAPCLSRALTQV